MTDEAAALGVPNWFMTRRRSGASVTPDLRESILDAWLTNSRVTVFLVEHLSPELWRSSARQAAWGS